MLDIDHDENPDRQERRKTSDTKNTLLGLPLQVISLESIMSHKKILAAL